MDLWIVIFAVIITIGNFIREYGLALGVILLISILIKQQLQINNLINKT